MEYGELLSIVFDKPDIEQTGLSFNRAAEVVEAFRSLADRALKFRALQDPSTGSIGTLPETFDIMLIADPHNGSIRLKMIGVAVAGVLSVVANGSQISGITIRDAFSAISAVQRPVDSDDEITLKLIRDREAVAGVSRLFKAAASSGCTYVAIERGNEIIVLHGGENARLSLIASEHSGSLSSSPAPSRIENGRFAFIEVYYQGRAYQAFLVDSKGGDPQPRMASGTIPFAVILWGSQAPLPGAAAYSIKSEEIEPGEVTHGVDLPEGFRRAQKVFLVTGATELNYR